MKFTCTKDNLAQALTLVGSVASKQVNLPILTNVLIQASESKVEILATNLETALRVQVRAKVDAPGSFTVPAKTIADYIHLLTDNQVEIELSGTELIVTGGQSSTKIKGAPSEEFPILPEVEDGVVYVIKQAELKAGLEKTVIAVAKNEIRPELSGVYFGFFTDRYAGLTVAATDSYRLAEKKIPVAQGGESVNCIVPARTVYEIIRLIGVAKGEEEQVRLWVSSTQIGVRYNNFEMTSRLVDGRYPDYAQIIPQTFRSSATIPSDVFVNKVKSASLFTVSGVNAVAITLDAAAKTVNISSTSTQTGEHHSQIDAFVEGESNAILLNHRYVLDGLQHIDGEVDLKINSADAPCLFQQKGTADYVYIVMPIRQ